MADECDFLIVCAVDDESDAVRSALETLGARRRKATKSIPYRFTLWRLKCDDGETYTIASITARQLGPLKAMKVVDDGLAAFDPKMVLMPGICAGRPVEEVHAGQIILAESAFQLGEGGKNTPEGVKQGARVSPPVGLDPALGVARENTDWNWRDLVAKLPRPDRRGRRGARVEPEKPLVGGYASSLKVEANNPWSELVGVDRKIIAVEMEGAALFEALRSKSDVHVLLAKAVQDFAVPPKVDDWRTYGCLASAIFVVTFIKHYATTPHFEELKARFEREQAFKRQRDKFTSQRDKLMPTWTTYLIPNRTGAALEPRPAMWRWVTSAAASKKARKLLVARANWGKSSFMEWATFAKPKEIVATFRCQISDKNSWNAFLFARVISEQLKTTLDCTISNDARAQLDGLGTKGASSGASDAIKALNRVFCDVDDKLVGRKPRRAYLLIDGIDEDLSADDEPSVVDVLGGNLELPTWLEIIATGQAFGDLQLSRTERARRWEVVDLAKDPKLKAVSLKDQHSVMRRVIGERLRGRRVSPNKKVITKKIQERAGEDFRLLNFFFDGIDEPRIDERWVDRLPSTIEDYYVERFKAWFHEEDDGRRSLAVKLLSEVLSSRQPYPLGRLATAADLASLDEARSILEPMAGLLEPVRLPLDDNSPIGIAKKGFGEWLRTSCDLPNRSGQNRPSEELGHKLLANYSFSSVANKLWNKRSHDRSGALEFLVRFGLWHMFEAAQAELTRLLNDPESDDELTHLDRSLGVLALCHSIKIRTSPGDVAKLLPTANGRFFDLLSEYVANRVDPRVDLDQLIHLIEIGCNQIPKLYPPLRVLGDHDFQVRAATSSDSGDHVTPQKSLYRIIGATQLLSRYSLGRALADSYHDGQPNDGDDKQVRLLHRATIEKLVDGLYEQGQLNEEQFDNLGVKDLEAYDLYEAACYAYKFIYARGVHLSSSPMRRLFPLFLKMAASSSNYNLRMIAGEMMIEMACDPGLRLPDSSLDRLAPNATRFWNPIWPYHQVDLAEALGTERHHRAQRGWSVQSPARAFTKAHAGRIGVVRERLNEVEKARRKLQSELSPKKKARGGKSGQSSFDFLLTCVEKYWEPEFVCQCLPRTSRELREATAMLVGKALWPFVLHPVWEITEAASTVIADLRELRVADMTTVIRRWNRNLDYWQAKYAAIDAAYNSRHCDASVDGTFAQRFRKKGKRNHLFIDLVHENYESPFERVRFIAAEDLFLACGDDVEETLPIERPRSLEKHRLETPRRLLSACKTPMQWWLKCGDDCSLLDEMFQFVQRVMKGTAVVGEEERPAWYYIECQSLLRQWFGHENKNVSDYLKCSNPKGEWWKTKRDDWLDEMEEVQQEKANPEKNGSSRSRRKSSDKRTAAIKQINISAAKKLAPYVKKSLTIERVTAVGPLLDACYEFFASVFEADVLDPKDTYEGSLARAEDEGSLPIFLAALIDLPGERWVAGFLSSDMMPVIGEPATAILAVGNIATSQQLLDAGVKGIGSRLLQAAVDAAGAKAAARGLQLRYALAEAEERSWGFWQNRGFRWPSKVNYLQPPLEFHDNGRPKHVEVDEKLMLSPLGRNESSIDGQLVRKIVQTVYENWCLKPYRGELSPKAMAVAEHYVMHTVFDRVAATISTDGPIDLVTVM